MKNKAEKYNSSYKVEAAAKDDNEYLSKFQNTNNQIRKKLKRTGEYCPIHLYGLPKVRKNAENPPFPPIVLMSGTVTNDVAHYLNEMIRPHIKSKYMVNSSDEFLFKINVLVMTPAQKVVSLHVSSLFTSISLDRTIDIIIQQAFSHPSSPPPVLPEDDLRNLLLICTKATSFKFSESSFIQIDGVSMRCPFGPTFVNFYMSHVENLTLNQNRASNPHIYMRYVNDLFCVFKSNRHISWFKQRFQNHCILKFTTE